MLKRRKTRKLNLTQEEKKKQAEERKIVREELKAKFAVAEVDGQKLEIANWTAEPSCLFAGRGDHPQRGKWKEGPREEDIILNLPKDVSVPPGNWKEASLGTKQNVCCQMGRQTHRKNQVCLVLATLRF